MKKILFTIALCAIIGITNAKENKNVGYPITQVPFTSVKLTSGTFWGQRLKASNEVTVPLALKKCEEAGRSENFKMAAHPNRSCAFEGYPFDDTDVYKTIEGASYLLQTFPNKN